VHIEDIKKAVEEYDQTQMQNNIRGNMVDTLRDEIKSARDEHEKDKIRMNEILHQSEQLAKESDALKKQNGDLHNGNEESLRRINTLAVERD
jgi:DNA-binding transcriptional MerR regulator